MGRSQQTFSKIEKEKKRLKKREEKRKKMEARKLAREENGSAGIPLAYVDHNGNLTDIPPDPTMKVKVKAKNIEISIPKKDDSELESDPLRNGKVSFFDGSKGYGFIVDTVTNEKHFFHISGMIDKVSENDKVSFELENGLRGMNAVKVKML